MVNPDTRAVLNRDAVIVDNLADSKVAEDNISRIDDRDSKAGDFCSLPHTNNGLEKD